jgi:hypothetical protein
LPISHNKAQQIAVDFHYLHRPAPCSQAFGLYCRSLLRGMIMYGTPSNRNLRKGICGPEERFNVMELTRLWIEDGTPKNAESFLIGFTLPKLEKQIVVAYADPTAGHIGTIYQATNWLYTGLSHKGQTVTRTVNGQHTQGMWDSLGRKRADSEQQESLFGPLKPEWGYQYRKLITKYGDKVVTKPHVPKHRYVYFNASGTRKAELMAKLRYPVLPYPKRWNVAQTLQSPHAHPTQPLPPPLRRRLR